jgi:uncharacterized protein YgbK (DUF1537 family)
MIDLAILADDITGAADTGVQFLPVFAPVYLLDHRSLSLEALEQRPQAVSVFTSSRGLTPAEAGRAVSEAGRAIRELHPQRVYKKIDSALRGHIGAELEAAMEALHLPFSFIAPAFPEQGRTTVGGIHFLHGVPVAQTEMGRDPVTPVTASSLPKWIGMQTSRSVAHIGLEVIEAGLEAAAGEVARQRSRGARHVGFDASGAGHLDLIARLALERFPETLLCGSAGLARHLARQLPLRTTVEADLRGAGLRMGGGGFLFVCGSASQTLRSQAAVLAEEGCVAVETLTPDALLRGEGAGGTEAALNRAVAALSQGDLLVQVAPPAEGPPAVDPHRLVSRLADFAVAVMRRAKTSGLFLSGGDTALAVLERLQVLAVRLEGELSSGLVCGVLAGGPWSGCRVVTKAGSFGGPETLLRMHRTWRPLL